MPITTCTERHIAVDDKFEDMKIEIEKERIERKESVIELKGEFKTTNDKIDAAVQEIRNQWFKNLFSLLKWAILAIFSLGGFILYHFAVGNLKLYP